MARFVVVLLLMVLLPGAAQAEWKLKRITGAGSVKGSGQIHPVVSCKNDVCFRSMERPHFFEGHKAPSGLPDGKIAVSRGRPDVRKAWYIQPTRRYDHGILGDAIEAGGLAVETASGKTISLSLPNDQVFEDRIPRLTDLNGDGKAEIITILSSLSKGASIAVFTLKGEKLVLKAKTPFIGRSYRWLNIAGIADFNGDGRKDIAGVWTPHIGGTLKIWTLLEGRLKKIGSLAGFSNHFIGSQEQRLSAIHDVSGNGKKDLILPSADRQSLRMVGFVKGRLRELARIKLPYKIDKAIEARDNNGKAIITLGLENDATYAVYK